MWSFVEYVAKTTLKHGLAYANTWAKSRCRNHIQAYINGGVKEMAHGGVKHTISTIRSRMRGRRMAGPEAGWQYVARGALTLGFGRAF